MATMLSRDLAAKALDTNAALLALTCEQVEADGALWVHDRESPDIYDANHAQRITASTPAGIERLLARAEREYAHCNHRRFQVDFRTSPLVSARLALDGYARDDGLMMVLQGELRAPPIEHDVRPVITDKDWEAYAVLKAADWEEHRRRLPDPKPGSEIAEAFVRIYRRKAPDVQYFMAYVDGRPTAFFSSWPGVDGVGQVEDLFTLPEWRRRGLATALMRRCVRACRERGAAQVAIACDPSDTPKQIYAAMGFVPAALDMRYLKRLDKPAAPSAAA